MKSACHCKAVLQSAINQCPARKEKMTEALIRNRVIGLQTHGIAPACKRACIWGLLIAWEQAVKATGLASSALSPQLVLFIVLECHLLCNFYIKSCNQSFQSCLRDLRHEDFFSHLDISYTVSFLHCDLTFDSDLSLSLSPPICLSQFQLLQTLLELTVSLENSPTHKGLSNSGFRIVTGLPSAELPHLLRTVHSGRNRMAVQTAYNLQP